VPKLKYIKYVLAVTVLFALIPLKVQAAPIDIDLEVSDSSRMDSDTFEVTATSLPYQFSVSTTHGFKATFVLYNENGNIIFSFHNIEKMTLETPLGPGIYQAFLMSTVKGQDGGASARGAEVPIPSSIILFGTSLIGLIGLRRRQKNASFSICNNSSTNGSDRTIPTAN
jgi:hypothetical protein